MEAEEALRSLIGEQIVGGGIDHDDGHVHLFTANGLILICFAVAILKTDETKHH